MALKDQVTAAREEANKAEEVKPTLELFDVKKGWNKEYFRKRFNSFKDLTEHYRNYLNPDNQHNFESEKDLARDIYGQENAFYQLFRSQPQNVKQDAKIKINGFGDSLSAYSYKNLNDLLNIIEGEETKKGIRDNPEKSIFIRLARGLKPYNTRGDNKEHDTLVGLIKRYQNMEKIKKLQDSSQRFGAMAQIVNQDIKDGYTDPVEAETCIFFGGSFVESRFYRIAKREGMVLDKILTNDKAKQLIRNYVDIAQKQFKDEDTDAGKREKIERRELNPLTIAISGEAFEILDAEHDEEEYKANPKKKDKEDRKKKRKEMGFSL